MSTTPSPRLAYSTDAKPATDEPRDPWLGITQTAWTCIGVVFALMVLLYWRNLDRLWDKTNPIYGQAADNWSHSVLVPIIGLGYLWLNREGLRATKSEPVMPTTRVPLLLGGGVALGFLCSATWLFSRAAGGLVELQPFLLPAAGVFIGLALVEAIVTLANVGAARFGIVRLTGGLAFLLTGISGQVLAQTGVLESTVGSNLAGYLGPLFFATAFLGLLALLLDWGLGCLIAGVLLSGYGIWPGQNDYLKDLGMVLATFGAVLTLAGWGVMKYAWFPIAFLVFALPWPGLVYSKVALPLQFLAAKVAVVVMNIAQVDTYVEGTKIIIERAGGERVLNVAEACAGMRSLMTFLTAGGAIAFLFGQRPMWQRLLIVASAVPIAILMNVARVSGQGLLDVYVSEDFSSGFAHYFAGLVMLIPAFFLLLGVVWVVDNLFVEVDEDEDEPSTPATTPAPA
ncbi:MAG: exosortase/archaeosortase family protein [Planctomycetota bacterium]